MKDAIEPCKKSIEINKQHLLDLLQDDNLYVSRCQASIHDSFISFHVCIEDKKDANK